MRRFLGICLSIVSFGCAEKPPERRALPERSVFVALERDFADFSDWGSFRLPDGKAAGETHPAGEHRVYVNALPPEGSRSFPVGTILVKHARAEAAEAGGEGARAASGAKLAETGEKYFAMVKRGGGFNAQGARGWEWFELKTRSDGSVGIVWRGLGAPTGESYGGDPLGSCNSCHQMSVQNDYVKSAALVLGAPRVAAR